VYRKGTGTCKKGGGLKSCRRWADLHWGRTERKSAAKGVEAKGPNRKKQTFFETSKEVEKRGTEGQNPRGKGMRRRPVEGFRATERGKLAWGGKLRRVDRGGVFRSREGGEGKDWREISYTLWSTD